MDEITQRDRYIPSIPRARLLLMLCAIFYSFGIHSVFGDLNYVVFAFAFPALYILSGFLVLGNSEDRERRIARTVVRTAICFLILAVVYFLLSLAVAPKETLSLIASRAFWIDLLIFNVWQLPVGSMIWYVQGLLYAYIIAYILCRLKLLRFDIVIAGICLVITLLTGELSGVVGFHLAGRTYLGGNFLTRALPYIMIGAFIGRKEDFFRKLDFLHHLLIAAAGLFLAAEEYFLLYVSGKKAYVGHLLGMGLVAVVICLYIIFVDGRELSFVPLDMLSRYEMSIPYYVCSPLNIGCALLLRATGVVQNVQDYSRILTIFGSFLILIVYSLAVYHFKEHRYLLKGEKDVGDDDERYY